MEVEVKMKKKTGETEIVKYASQQNDGDNKSSDRVEYCDCQPGNCNNRSKEPSEQIVKPLEGRKLLWVR